MRPRYAPRHLSLVARRLQLFKAAAAEAARLRELEDDNPEPTDVLPIEKMNELVFANESEAR
jgi:hypothetical protein